MTKAPKTRYNEQAEYLTKDGSTIRELMHPDVHSELGAKKQSLAEARVVAGMSTALHQHTQSEEIYHIVSGNGLIRLGSDEFEVGPGDTICIPPGTSHCIKVTDDDELRFLCCSSPAYSHDDTVLIDE